MIDAISPLRPMTEHLDADVRRIEADSPIAHLHLASVDALLGGLRDRLSVIAAKPGAGKTTLLISILDDAARDGIPCVLFEEELSRRSVLSKSLVRLSGGLLTTGDLEGHQGGEKARALGEAVARYREEIAPRMYIVDGPTGLRDMDRCVSEVAEAHGRPPVVGVDYVQIVPMPPELQSIEERVSLRLVLGGLHDLATRYGCPVFALSSINRTGYAKAKPSMDNLGGSSYIEYGSDVVIGLSRDKNDDGARGAEQRVTLATLKHRYGPCGSVRLVFDGARATFYEVGR